MVCVCVFLYSHISPPSIHDILISIFSFFLLLLFDITHTCSKKNHETKMTSIIVQENFKHQNSKKKMFCQQILISGTYAHTHLFTPIQPPTHTHTHIDDIDYTINPSTLFFHYLLIINYL